MKRSAAVLLFAATPLLAQNAGPIIDSAARDKLVTLVEQAVATMYVEPDVAPKLAREIRARMKSRLTPESPRRSLRNG